MTEPWLIKCIGCPAHAECRKARVCELRNEPLVDASDAELKNLRAIQNKIEKRC